MIYFKSSNDLYVQRQANLSIWFGNAAAKAAEKKLLFETEGSCLQIMLDTCEKTEAWWSSIQRVRKTQSHSET
jgi:hypothetical protein